MIKIRMIVFFLLLCFVYPSIVAAQHGNEFYKKINVTTHHTNNTLTITNHTKENLNLKNAILTFYDAAEINHLYLGKESLKFSKQDFLQQSHNPGNQYKIILDQLPNPILLPQQTFNLKIDADRISDPSNVELKLIERTALPVRITASNANWVTTISICNTTSSPIPLTDVELNFNFAQSMPSNIWGQPWVGWRVASQTGTQVVLLGGTQWTPALQPDPNCTSPLTVQFNAAPTVPLPTGPFVFKAEGAVTPATGILSVNMPQAPAAGLQNPNITVTGPNTNQSRVVNWGEKWVVSGLAPGSYTVTAANVNNTTDFYTASPVTVTVSANATANAAVTYTRTPTTNVTVTLTNSPELQQQITLTGAKYTFTRTVNNNTVLALPADSYNVSALAPGYSVIASPNPLVVPTNTTLNISFQQAATGPRFVGFMESWNETSTTDDAAKTNLGNIPAYINVVNIAFMKPDAVYTKGSLNYEGTGLQLQYPSQTVLKFAVARLHREHPNTKVLISVGGPTYTNWAGLNAQAIADFIVDYGLDGVDINFMPSTPGCATGADGLVHCQIDAAFKGYVDTLRAELPRPFWLTITSYGVGAFGEGQWRTATPQNAYTGIMLPLLRTASASSIDMINVMSYDLGATYNPIQALAAYSNFFPGPISMGVEVPPEAAGGHVYDLCQVTQLTEAVKTSAAQRHNTAPAMMLWSLAKKPTGTITPSNPSAQMIATTICTSLGLTDCSQPVLLPSYRMKHAS